MSISLEPPDQSSQNCLCKSPEAVARSSSSGIVIHCVLLVLWVMSSLAIPGHMALRGRLTLNLLPLAIAGRSLMSMNAVFHFVCYPHLLYSVIQCQDYSACMVN